MAIKRKTQYCTEVITFILLYVTGYWKTDHNVTLG